MRRRTVVDLVDDPGAVDAAEAGKPLLGICLGMQMLLTTSEEADHAGQGDAEGLDLFPGENVRFGGELTVPHMGWNKLDVRRDHPLVEGPATSRITFIPCVALNCNESAT